MPEIKNAPPKREEKIGGPVGRPGRGPGPVMNVEKAKNTKGTLKKLVSYIGRSKYLFISLTFVMLVITVLNLVAPALQQKAIDLITLTDGKLTVDKASFLSTLIVLIITYAIAALFTYFQGLFAAKLSTATVRKLRFDLFHRLVRLPIRYTDTHNHGDIMSRMTNDVENISNTVSASVAALISAVLSVLGSIVIMLLYSPLMTLISVLTVVLTIIVSTNMSKYMRKFYKQQQEVLGEMNGHVEEMVTGYKTVVAFSKEQKSKDEFNDISSRFRKVAIKAQILSGSMGPLMNIISNLSFILVALSGAYFAFKGSNIGGILSENGIITVGVIQAFLLYSKQLSRPINEIANQYALIQNSIAGAERIFAVMDSEPEKDDGKDQFKAENVRGDISFKNVCFGYSEEKQVLNNFTLDVKQGQKIAIVGATGSGKTTIVNLLTRFYDITKGEITIDGKSIFDIPKDELRKTIAIVLQDTVLFSESIRQNILYGKLDATEEEIITAAKTANAERFITRLKESYDTKLSEGGSNLSQGQRQLLSIARAVLADPKILILDEATSSVDTRTEMRIQSAMLKLMQNRTSLIIAHRLSTIRDADKIIVIDNGTIAESGNHEELLEKKGCYYRLYNNQFAGIET
ncbi:MAG: ABC transporter ATP-binding protein [Ruminococcaceae bacterium]|nr:ABC transporter ATP-binding protein [Oscillospiraceae bacterium]